LLFVYAVEAETLRYVRQYLKKRESAPKRSIGVGYKVIRGWSVGSIY